MLDIKPENIMINDKQMLKIIDFGYTLGQEAIDLLVDQLASNPKNNYFLVAKINNRWAGTIHIATHEQEAEFGVIVALQYRKQGIANLIMDEAITWARNRYYRDLFMHCISWNRPIKHLCQKHGLVPRNMMGDSEANLQLEPPTPATFFKEQMIVAKRNWLAMFLLFCIISLAAIGYLPISFLI